jgi:hypothetical protein
LRLGEADFDASGAAATALAARVVGWVSGALERLARGGLVLHPVVANRVVTEEAPAAHRSHVRVVLAPSPEAEPKTAPEATGSNEGVVLFVAVARDGLEVGCAVRGKPPLEAVRRWLAGPHAARVLPRVLSELPEEFDVRVADAHTSTTTTTAATTPSTTERAEPFLAARTASLFQLEAAIGRAERASLEVRIGWRVPRSLAVPNADILDEQLEDALVALAPLFETLTGVAANQAGERQPAGRPGQRSPTRIGERHGEKRGARPAKGGDKGRAAAKHPTGNKPARSAAAATARPAKGARPEAEPPHVAIAEESERAREESVVRPPPAPATERPPRLSSSLARPRLMARRMAPAGEIDPSVPVERGTRVHVLAGPFAGRTGVVKELDGRGGACVLLGLLAMWVPVKDLAASAEGRERPALGSSHRKPLLAR